MAAPTSVRVEATSQTTTVLRWTYAGGLNIKVYRSTDGISYASVGGTSGTITTFTDTGLAVGTKYYYKLTDDEGLTFSSVVTVITHVCLSPAGSLDVLTLPRFDGSEQQSDDLNNLAQRVEAALGDRVLEPEQCIACPNDGAIVIDCSNGCIDWVVIADENINSISLQWCEGPPGTVEFVVPPNTSGRQICGWPGGFGFTGDECNKAPITTGAFGTSISVGIGGAGGQGAASNPSSRRGYNPGSRSGGGGSGGSGCTCVPTANGALTIKSCNSNNSLNCSTTKVLKLLVCGGRGPYNWSKTGSVQLKGSNQPVGNTAVGSAIEVTPPTNAGSAVAGNAYTVAYHCCNHCAAGACDAQVTDTRNFKCDDTAAAACNGAAAACSPAGVALSALVACTAGTDCPGCLPYTCGTNCGSGQQTSCDARTAPMIAAGCAPCGLSAGDTVSVTDAAGVTVTVILQA